MRCTTCGRLTELVDAEQCNLCWEVERRLATYLAQGGDGAERFIIETLLKKRAEPVLGPKGEPAVKVTVEGLSDKPAEYALEELRFTESTELDRASLYGRSIPTGIGQGTVLIVGRYRFGLKTP